MSVWKQAAEAMVPLLLSGKISLDIVSILHVFSCRLYGLRKYKKQIERDEEIVKELQDGDQSHTRAENQDS